MATISGLEKKISDYTASISKKNTEIAAYNTMKTQVKTVVGKVNGGVKSLTKGKALLTDNFVIDEKYAAQKEIDDDIKKCDTYISFMDRVVADAEKMITTKQSEIKNLEDLRTQAQRELDALRAQLAAAAAAAKVAAQAKANATSSQIAIRTTPAKAVSSGKLMKQ